MISRFSSEFLAKVEALLNMSGNIEELNESLENKTGIIDFFRSYHGLEQFRQFLDGYRTISKKNRDLGDFQTPIHLTDEICRYIIDVGFAPDAVIEPTCGEGNFVTSAIRLFPSLKHAYCVDVQSKYEWLLKLNILELSLRRDIHVAIEFYRDNIFTHRISDRFRGSLDNYIQHLLILGNPPWVTNSELSTLNSNNLPSKSNIKGYSGIEAITGRGNFDIAEYIVLQMIHRFSRRKGKIAMLCKTSVIKNIVRDMQGLYLRISNIQELLIDARKEFDVAADAALFVADFGSGEASFCTVSSLYQPDCQSKKYGWVGGKFASDIELYGKYKHIDGQSPFVWRQGVKHDASKVMVLRINADGDLLNGLQEDADVERDLLYPFIRGADLRESLVRSTANRVIITQTSPSQDTQYITLKYPKLWAYLTSHSEYLDRRKSSIYRKRPRFSIFGIGDYSFKPYKVAVSGFYKKCNFSLVLPISGRPAMLDDTCYHLSFDSFDDAFFTWTLLNTSDVRKFLSLIEELPEETVSLRRSDFPLYVVLEDGQEVIVLLEIQTVFNRDFVLRLISYTVRFMLEYHLKVIPLVLLLTPSRPATGVYTDELLTFDYRVVRFWEQQSRDFLNEMQLYPFLPLMAGGEDTLEEAETAIYENAEISMERKGDLLTAMAIFAGLKDKDLADQLIKRRRDIMIQSAAYDIIKEEGIKEGEKRGLYDAISFGLELKFGTDGLALVEKVLKVESREKLEVVKEAIKIANKIEEVEKLI